jgi:hypothetical protein
MGGRMTEEQKFEMAVLNEKAKKEQSREALLDQLDRSGLGNEGAFIPTELDEKIINALPRFTQETLAKHFKDIFDNEIMRLRDAGQKEYAHDSTSPFANFRRAAEDVGIDAKKVLWIFAMKHKDGIAAFIKGHTSQREDVRGRINDLIVYMFLLRGMIDEEMGTMPTGAGLGDLVENSL